MSAGAFDRASTAARVADLLRARILDGTMPPGSRIVELEIARELGVSRSPVREALLRLEGEGLAAIVPYRGALVTPPQRERFGELMEFRLALERFALDRLVERLPEGAIGQLRARAAALRKAVSTRNLRRAVDEDLAVHRTIVRLAGNALLERAYEELLAQIRLYIAVTSARYARIGELADEHDALIGAIERRDLRAARKLLDAHVAHGLDEPAPGRDEPSLAPAAGPRRRNFAKRPR